MAVRQRRYTKRTKLAAVMAAEISGVTQAAEQMGIPHQTISYWMNDEELGEIRRKTREDLADEIKVVSHLAWQRVAASLRSGEMEPRDAIFAAEKATSLQILMTGGATSRTESRELNDLPDSAYVEHIHAAEDLIRASAGRTSETPSEEPTG